MSVSYIVSTPSADQFPVILDGSGPHTVAQILSAAQFVVGSNHRLTVDDRPVTSQSTVPAGRTLVVTENSKGGNL